MTYDADGTPPRRPPSRKSVYDVLADAVNVDAPHEVMIVDRGLLRWAMVMSRTESTPSSKRPTAVAPVRRYRLGPTRRTTGRL